MNSFKQKFVEHAREYLIEFSKIYATCGNAHKDRLQSQL